MRFVAAPFGIFLQVAGAEFVDHVIAGIRDIIYVVGNYADINMLLDGYGYKEFLWGGVKNPGQFGETLRGNPLAAVFDFVDKVMGQTGQIRQNQLGNFLSGSQAFNVFSQDSINISSGEIRHNKQIIQLKTQRDK
jgi:hypothetical protein